MEQFWSGFWARLLEQSFAVLLMAAALLYQTMRCRRLERQKDELSASLIASARESSTTQSSLVERRYEQLSGIVMKLARAFSSGPKPKLCDLVELIEDDFQLKLSEPPCEGTRTQRLGSPKGADSEPPSGG